VSRRTKEWDRLYAEGLFHPNSGYPSPEEIDPVQAVKLQEWNERITTAWPNGAGWEPLPAPTLARSR